jgi:hypothetical protein
MSNSKNDVVVKEGEVTGDLAEATTAKPEEAEVDAAGAKRPEKQERLVPYERFAEVNTAKKKAEAELEQLRKGRESVADKQLDLLVKEAEQKAHAKIAPYLAEKREQELHAEMEAMRQKYPLADTALMNALLALNPELELEEAAKVAQKRVEEIRLSAQEEYKRLLAYKKRGIAEQGGASAAGALRPKTLADATEAATRAFARHLEG